MIRFICGCIILGLCLTTRTASAKHVLVLFGNYGHLIFILAFLWSTRLFPIALTHASLRWRCWIWIGSLWKQGLQDSAFRQACSEKFSLWQWVHYRQQLLTEPVQPSIQSVIDHHVTTVIDLLLMDFVGLLFWLAYLTTRTVCTAWRMDITISSRSTASVVCPTYWTNMTYSQVSFILYSCTCSLELRIVRV